MSPSTLTAVRVVSSRRSMGSNMAMAAGSVAGAFIGAQLAAHTDQNALKIGLGIVLLAAAWVSSRR